MSGDRPRVALVAHEVHDRGGMERVCFELVARGSAEWDFVVLSRELDPRLRSLADWRRIPTPGRPFPLKFVAFALVAGLRLRRLRVDLVHVLGALVPNQADVSSVHFCHAAYVEATGRLAPPDAPPLRRLNTSLSRVLALAFERWCYGPSRVRTLAAVSRGVADELRRHYRAPEIVVTPNGVESDRFASDPTARRELRDAHGVGDDDVIVLFVGGDWNRKGLGVAIEGAAEAAQLGAELRLWVVGPGDEERFRRQARRLGVAVEFFGRQAAVERWYSAADVFVFPTLYEAAPLVGYEAAAAGLPIVATAVNGIVELIGDGGAGILVAREPQAVGAALARLTSDPDERRRLGAEAAQRAAAYSWESSVRTLLDVYADLREGAPC